MVCCLSCFTNVLFVVHMTWQKSDLHLDKHVNVNGIPFNTVVLGFFDIMIPPNIHMYIVYSTLSCGLYILTCQWYSLLYPFHT